MDLGPIVPTALGIENGCMKLLIPIPSVETLSEYLDSSKGRAVLTVSLHLSPEVVKALMAIKASGMASC